MQKKLHLKCNFFCIQKEKWELSHDTQGTCESGDNLKNCEKT